MTDKTQNLSAIDISMTYIKHWKAAITIFLIFIAVGVYLCINYQRIHFSNIIASGEKVEFNNTGLLTPPRLVTSAAQSAQQNTIMLNSIFIPRAIADYQQQHHTSKPYKIIAEQIKAHTGSVTTSNIYLYQLKSKIAPEEQAAYEVVFNNITKQFIDYQNQMTNLSITLAKNQQTSLKNQIAYLKNPHTLKALNRNLKYHILVSDMPNKNDNAAVHVTLQSLSTNLKAELKNTQVVLNSVHHAQQMLAPQQTLGTGGTSKPLILIISLFLGFVFTTIYAFSMELIINIIKQLKA